MLASPTASRRPSSSTTETSVSVNAARPAPRYSEMTPSGACPASSGVLIALRGRMSFTMLIASGSALAQAGMSAAALVDSWVVPEV